MRERRLDASCGLYCGACLIYQCTQSHTLARAAEVLGRPEEGLACDGCRSERVTIACRECGYRDCATGRGLASCAECPEMPCPSLHSLQTRRPHLVEVVGNLERIRGIGWRSWGEEQATRWCCPLCGKATGWYETTCARCGTPLATGYAGPSRADE